MASSVPTPSQGLPVVDSVAGCVCIPVYNHEKTVAAVVREALSYASTVLVFDDGSTDGSGDRARAAGATVLSAGRNRGKGAALKALFAEAAARGFAYAFTLDADGQHHPSDLAMLAATVSANKGAIVVGTRDLQKANAPGSSQFGQKFSNFWVWFEGGQRVDDSQSGFRAYPLPATVALGGRRKRYDFEVEILVRAGWAGLPVISVPIAVTYPPDRITHFKAFKDNARISVLNTEMCTRLVLPWPLLMNPSTWWSWPRSSPWSLHFIRTRVLLWAYAAGALAFVAARAWR